MVVNGDGVAGQFEPPSVDQVCRSLGTPMRGSLEEAMCEVIREVTGSNPTLGGGTRFLRVASGGFKAEVIQKTGRRLSLEPKKRAYSEPDESYATITDIAEYYFGD